MRKTHKSVAKRFKVTGTGKLKHSKTCRNHLLTNKHGTKRDKFGKLVHESDMRRMRALLPHSV